MVSTLINTHPQPNPAIGAKILSGISKKHLLKRSLDWLMRLPRQIGSHPIILPTDEPTGIFLADHRETLKGAFLFPRQRAGLIRALCNKQTIAFWFSRDDPMPFFAMLWQSLQFGWGKLLAKVRKAAFERRPSVRRREDQDQVTVPISSKTLNSETPLSAASSPLRKCAGREGNATASRGDSRQRSVSETHAATA